MGTFMNLNCNHLNLLCFSMGILYHKKKGQSTPRFPSYPNKSISFRNSFQRHTITY
jgi:hypothetical protein